MTTLSIPRTERRVKPAPRRPNPDPANARALGRLRDPDGYCWRPAHEPGAVCLATLSPWDGRTWHSYTVRQDRALLRCDGVHCAGVLCVHCRMVALVGGIAAAQALARGTEPCKCCGFRPASDCGVCDTCAAQMVAPPSYNTGWLADNAWLAPMPAPLGEF